MDWDKLRVAWRDDAPAARLAAVDELRTLDRALWTTVRRRDLLESIAAVVVAGFFVLTALGSFAEGAWLAGAFALLILAWSLTVPFHMRRARRLAADTGHAAPLLDYLRRQRDAALAQARMLEQVWLWYLSPPAIGIAGLTLARDGITGRSLGYLGLVLLLYAGVAWLNRHTARTRFRAHADALQRQIDALSGDGT